MSDTSSAKARFEEKKKNCDAVYGILDTWKNWSNMKEKVDVNTTKLLERMDLDRPILQREKFELIFLEKANRQPLPTDPDKPDSPGSVNKSQDEMKIGKIRQEMIDRMKQRKKNNNFQLIAYEKMCQFIKTRFSKEKITPNRIEINLMEVVKKIVESGWILQTTEVRQLF